ncbi:unnamed protein product [Cylicocyclus nassatus]|uniref:SCP domain-containing protein n=1 Tax=Cylicocyclus nassatus TaxID=53992 RepID=A0AA36H0L8_CYLNA|nr:unnamed protein product [Cylicocyclus nassatus]
MVHNFLFYTLGILAVLTSVCKGAAQCENGRLSEDAINSQVLDVINGKRSLVARGLETNAKNAKDGEYLPKGKAMNKLTWSCDLEAEALTFVSSCSDDKPDPAPGKSQIYFRDYDYDYELSFVIGDLFLAIDSEALVVNTNAVTYDGQTNLLNYANLIRASITEIGCGWRKCSGAHPTYILYCLTNQPELTNGEIIYEQGNGNCDSCPADTICEAAESLCYRNAPLTTTTNSKTTTSTTTTRTTTSTPPTTTSTTTTRVTTTLATTTQATTTPAKSEAILPLANPGENMQCPENIGMTDTLRMHFLDTTNYRRSILAKGQVTDNTNQLLPTATNMFLLIWDCELEKNAIDYVKTCPTTTYITRNDEEAGENIHRVPISSEVPTYRDAIKNAVVAWWKVVRQYPGPGATAMFYPMHYDSPIASYTRMAWSSTRRLGCAIGQCSSEYVVICRYLPRGNAIYYPMYNVGLVCSACPIGTSCQISLGLCG